MHPRVLCACVVFLQIAQAQPTASHPTFEVASVKPSDPNSANPMWIGMTANDGMVRLTNITLQDCIRAAYRLRDFQVQGLEWIKTARFEIIAKLPAGASREAIPEMLQSLLAERFKLTLRREMKDHPVYALLPGKGQVKLKPAEATAAPPDNAPTALGPDGKPRAPMMVRFQPTGVHLIARSATLASFVELMSRFTERPVVDMTGIAGKYDLDLTFAPEIVRTPLPGTPSPPEGVASDPAPSVFDAVRQIGLTLESRKAPLETLIVINAEKTPLAN